MTDLAQFAEVLACLVAVEGRIELVRQELAQCIDFNPKLIFEYLRRTYHYQGPRGQYAFASDVLSFSDFLLQLDIECQPDELFQVFQVFRADPTAANEYSKFLLLLTPYEKIMPNRDKHVSPTQKLLEQNTFYRPPRQEILALLAHIFQIELELVRFLRTKREESPQFPFDLSHVFYEIDYKRLGFLDFEEVNKFMKNTGNPFNMRDYRALLRRLKKTSHVVQNTIYFEELADYFFPRYLQQLMQTYQPLQISTIKQTSHAVNKHTNSHLTNSPSNNDFFQSLYETPGGKNSQQPHSPPTSEYKSKRQPVLPEDAHNLWHSADTTAYSKQQQQPQPQQYSNQQEVRLTQDSAHQSRVLEAKARLSDTLKHNVSALNLSQSQYLDRSTARKPIFPQSEKADHTSQQYQDFHRQKQRLKYFSNEEIPKFLGLTEHPHTEPPSVSNLYVSKIQFNQKNRTLQQTIEPYSHHQELFLKPQKTNQQLNQPVTVQTVVYRDPFVNLEQPPLIIKPRYEFLGLFDAIGDVFDGAALPSLQKNQAIAQEGHLDYQLHQQRIIPSNLQQTLKVAAEAHCNDPVGLKIQVLSQRPKQVPFLSKPQTPVDAKQLSQYSPFKKYE